jgi:hypothetical protein
LKGFAVKTNSLVGLAGALVIAFFASQAAAQEGECPRVDADENVKALGINYYPPAKTVGNFVPAVIVGKVMYLAGNGPKMPNGKFVAGKTSRAQSFSLRGATGGLHLIATSRLLSMALHVRCQVW